MSTYAAAQRTSSGSSGAAGWEIRNGATTKAKVMEVGLSLVAATASVIGLGRPAAIGITPTSPVTFLDEGDGGAPAGLLTHAIAWGTGPTVPAAFLRRVSLPATIGAGVIWQFPEGLGLPISGSIVLWNLAANSVLDVWAYLKQR